MGLGKSYGCLQWRGDGIRWPSFMSEGQEREAFMRVAIAEAQSVDERCVYPNPRVGAVIVENGEIVARGRFELDGGMHAERKVLAALGRNPAPDAVLYVTLEPCSTHGRTGACTEAIMASGLGKVVVGAIDPTSGHRGRGLSILRDAGIDVVSGCLLEECAALNPGYSGRETSRPRKPKEG